MRVQLLPFCAAVLSAAAATGAVRPVSFQAPQAFPAGRTPGAVAVADFNRDGSLDLAVSMLDTNCTSCDTIAVLLNNGDGTFQSPVNYKVGTDPDFVVAGDFNGDGIPDLAVANFGTRTVGTGSISILLGKGDGTFQPALNFPEAGSNPVALAVGDFNGDGILDLVAANPYASNGLAILLGNGNGTFAPAVNYAVAGGALESVAVGDFNGDGKLDLVAADDGVAILLGNGDGTFQPAVFYPIPTVVTAAVVADFNGDGRLDVAVGDLYGGWVYVFLGNGDGTFQPYQQYYAGYEISSIAVADFNADGKPDLAVAGYNYDRVSVLLGNGDGSFQPSLNYFVGSFANWVAAADFNGDGKADLALSTNNDNAVLILPGNGDGSFPQTLSYTIHDGPLKTEPISAGVADFNGDGKQDIALATANPNSVTILLGTGDGAFQPPLNYTIGGAPHSIVVGDFNGDGKLDLAVTYGAATDSVGTVSILLGNGDGTFQNPVNYSVGSQPLSLAVGDFNGDGKQDLAVANLNSGNFSILLGNGDGTFQPATSYSAGINPSALVVGDFNGDGKLDLALAGFGSIRHGTVSILLGNGNGSFQSPVTYLVGSRPASMAAGDLNGDGKLDLVVACEGQNAAAILLGNGDGTFQQAVNYTVSGGPSSVVIGDFNGDKYPDMAFADSSSGSVSILLGNGDGTFQPQVIYLGGGLPRSLAVGDFHGHGKTDLVVTNPGSFSITMLANTTP